MSGHRPGDTPFHSRRRLFLYGSGGHARVIADMLVASGMPRLAGYIDDEAGPRAPATGTMAGLAWFGTLEWLREEAERSAAEMSIVLGIGDNQARAHRHRTLAAWGYHLPAIVDPSARISPSVELGGATVVMPLAVINSLARVGQAVIVNSSAVVEHDCDLGDYCHVSPHATMAGKARLGTGAHLGAGAIVLPGVSVGADAIIGAGAVVCEDIPEMVVAAGVPARVLRPRTDLL